MQEATEKEIIRLEKEQNDNIRKDLMMTKTVLESIASIKNDTQSLKEHQGKNNLIVYGIVFSAGILFGLWFKVWTPIAGDIVDAVQIAKHIKGN